MEESSGNKEAMRELTLIEWANKLRWQIKDTAKETKHFGNRMKIGGEWFTPQNALDIEDIEIEGNKGEMIANAILAYRHLEDASTRLDKVIQAHDGV